MQTASGTFAIATVPLLIAAEMSDGVSR